MILGQLETPNCYWVVLGTTRGHCKQLIIEAWKVHCAAFGADPSYCPTDDIQFNEIAVGQVLRNGDLLYSE